MEGEEEEGGREESGMVEGANHLFLGGGIIASVIGPDFDPFSSLMCKH